MSTWRVLVGDCRETLRTLPEASVQCCVTSPPFWGLRDYGHPDQLGLEATPEQYVERMVDVFREVRRTCGRMACSTRSMERERPGSLRREHHRKYVGIELNPEYVAIAERRMAQGVLPLLAM